MISFGVYNAGASSADSFASKKKRPKFRETLVEHVEQMQESGVSVVFMQELHPEVHTPLPKGWTQVHEKSAEGNHLRVWFKESQLEFLASTQEQVLTSRFDEAHHWRKWQKVWFLHRESRRVILGANVHTIDGQKKHRIRGGGPKRLKFKSRCLQAILEQVVASMWRPDFSSPSHDAGQSGQPCSIAIPEATLQSTQGARVAVLSDVAEALYSSEPDARLGVRAAGRQGTDTPLVAPLCQVGKHLDASEAHLCVRIIRASQDGLVARAPRQLGINGIL